MQKNKGITLVALVITIIILLILAGVAISMITGGEGLFPKANEAAGKYNNAASTEANILNNLLHETNDNAYRIYNAQQLRAFASEVNNGENFNGKTVVIMADIDLGAKKDKDNVWQGDIWTPIANTAETAFAGILEGNNHTIKGMYVNSNNANAGLIAYNAGTIQNIKIENSYVHAKNEAQEICSVGLLVGENRGIVNNCYNSGELFYEGNNLNGVDYIGGIIGINLLEVTECHNTGNVKTNTKTKYPRIGGICGNVCNNNAVLKNSSNTGKISVTDMSIDGAFGGCVGILNNGNIENIKNSGELEVLANGIGEAAVYNIGGVIGGTTNTITENEGSKVTKINNEGTINILEANGKYVRVGGTIGLTTRNSIISNAENNGAIIAKKITGEAFQVGGVAATEWLNSTIENSINNENGTINLEYEVSRAQVGGIVANISSSSILKDSCNLANINIINGNAKVEYSALGGIVGINYDSASVEKCKNIGNLKYTTMGKDIFIGGIAGNNNNSATINNSYTKGNIEGTFTNTGAVYIGRIVGLNNRSAVVNNCYTTGTMSNTGTTGTRKIDFFHGYNVATLNNLYYLSKTTTQGYDYAVRNFEGTTTNFTKSEFINKIGSENFKILEEKDFYPILSWE